MLISPASFCNIHLHCISFQCSLSIFDPVGQPQSNWTGMALGPSRMPLFLQKSEAEWKGKAAAPLQVFHTSPGSTWLAAQLGCAGFLTRTCIAIACTWQALLSNPSRVFQHLSYGKRTPDLVSSSKTQCYHQQNDFCLFLYISQLM